ncbi:2,3-bisphosphoglycerate-independent phosphoglycerate mutase [Synechococcus sp. CS-1325]|uniref:2,3-bisphosphoglycerate-independent phosphoglycerate mutase n=1 Tax=unclassified Synechococcus TaxID=2626047 RepID=UPI000DB27641|nr:2,3-bisphosphoglycerate-independent phosphoglycerate mutase [Synechococcus sp. CS-1325]MCT0212294.1 2,3-bisphosphoglycerate-independent phosphoglycerate mutase [Synechococcus sp. CS-1326]MCT0234293.1 2,3-bisphosphoglycerate-independent phosphoglycerate mutase [Synechococcus sp. CS-1327]PZV01191.1 MAG: 2,3-bisphosphoglycerate-independent phosphoglycerate mutase [Cyanobium sp.]
MPTGPNANPSPDVGASASAGGKAPVSPVVLAILDGWGYGESSGTNAITEASTPVMDALWQVYPHALIQASGGDVGLPDGQMGNSEVGHLTIGSGRIIRQELVRISKAATDGSLAENPALNDLADHLLATGGSLHLLGLCSNGGVHSHIDHLGSLLQWAADRGLKEVFIHAITDGRDTPPQSALPFLDQIDAQIASVGVGRISTLCGRYWAMDRDNRWDRTEKAFRLLTESAPIAGLTAQQAVEAAYAAGINDEFIEPLRLDTGELGDGDGLICFNFRPDRARQLLRSLALERFDGFVRQQLPRLRLVTFTQYEAGLPVEVAFPPESLDGLLGQVVSEHGLLQLRTAETEKYPHVTYFMNGGIEQPFPGEDRHLVPSPRVATYDQSPEMSADALTESCIASINKGIYSLIVINYANPDMVGHTGMIEATKTAISTVDRCIGQLVEATNRKGGTLLITADHGNAEMMRSSDGRPWTAHTTNPVPVILVEGEKRKLPGHGAHASLRSGGGLADIAPTLLDILDLPQPARMTGRSLIDSADVRLEPTPEAQQTQLYQALQV